MLWSGRSHRSRRRAPASRGQRRMTVNVMMLVVGPRLRRPALSSHARIFISGLRRPPDSAPAVSRILYFASRAGRRKTLGAACDHISRELSVVLHRHCSCPADGLIAGAPESLLSRIVPRRDKSTRTLQHAPSRRRRCLRQILFVPVALQARAILLSPCSSRSDRNIERHSRTPRAGRLNACKESDMKLYDQNAVGGCGGTRARLPSAP